MATVAERINRDTAVPSEFNENIAKLMSNAQARIYSCLGKEMLYGAKPESLDQHLVSEEVKLDEGLKYSKSIDGLMMYVVGDINTLSISYPEGYLLAQRVEELFKIYYRNLLNLKTEEQNYAEEIISERRGKDTFLKSIEEFNLTERRLIKSVRCFSYINVIVFIGHIIARDYLLASFFLIASVVGVALEIFHRAE